VSSTRNLTLPLLHLSETASCKESYGENHESTYKVDEETKNPEAISEGPSTYTSDCPHIVDVVREVFAKDKSVINAEPLFKKLGSPGAEAVVTPETLTTTGEELHGPIALLLLAMQDESAF